MHNKLMSGCVRLHHQEKACEDIYFNVIFQYYFHKEPINKKKRKAQENLISWAFRFTF